MIERRMRTMSWFSDEKEMLEKLAVGVGEAQDYVRWR